MVNSIGNGNSGNAQAAEQARRAAAEQAKRQAAAEQRQREIAAQAQREIAAQKTDLKINKSDQTNQTGSLQMFSERRGLDANVPRDFQLAKFTKNQTNGESLPTAGNYHALLASGKPSPQKTDGANLFGQARELYNNLRTSVEENSFAGKAFKAFDDFAGKTKSLFASAQFGGNAQPVPQNVALTFTGKGAEFDYNKSGSIEPDATPEEAVQFILRTEQTSMTSENAGTEFFLKALNDHKGDNQWNQEFFKQLGAEKTSALISDSLTTGVHQYSSPEDVDAKVAMLRDTISGLASANPPKFTQADMNTLVESMVRAPGDFNELIALEVFGKMGYEQENVKNMFFNSASQLALSDKFSDDEYSQLAAAATHVLSNTSSNNQAEKLNEIRESGEGKLTKLVGLAMKGTTETPSLQKRLGTLMQYPGEHGPAISEPYGRVDSLVFNAAYSGYSDAHSRGPAVSSDDLRATRMELFTAASQNLADEGVRGKYEDSTLLKDGLSQIYMEDYDSIIKSSLGENEASLKPEFKTIFKDFFEFTVFTDKPGNLQKSLMNFTVDKFTEMGKALTDKSEGAEKRFEEKFGYNREDGSSILGLMLGTMTTALKDSNNRIKEDAEAQAESVGFIFDVTIGLIPGVGDKISEGAKSVVTSLLGSVAGTVQDTVLEQIKTNSVDGVRDAFIKANSDGDPSNMLFGLYNSLDQILPNEGDNNLLTQLRDAYNSVINSSEIASEAD